MSERINGPLDSSLINYTAIAYFDVPNRNRRVWLDSANIRITYALTKESGVRQVPYITFFVIAQKWRGYLKMERDQTLHGYNL
jgi:hypothetical protein